MVSSRSAFRANTRAAIAFNSGRLSFARSSALMFALSEVCLSGCACCPRSAVATTSPSGTSCSSS